MPAEKEVYARHAAEYEALVSREDYQGNILKAIREIVPLEGLDALDLGAGTGRLACLLQPYVRRVTACDLSPHMLGVALDKLRRGGKAMVAAADHRRLPLAGRTADLIVSGWSVSYVTVWAPERWRTEADAWLAEARRVPRIGGHIILLESLGTGNETPQRLPHLANFYGWLDEQGFHNRWIRTDYRFGSMEAAARTAGFFFGEDMAKHLREQAPGEAILPECSGVWWLDG